MGTISSARAVYGLSASGTHTRTNVDGAVTIGVGQTQMTFADADIAYSYRAILAPSATLAFDLSTSAADSPTPWQAGQAQIETATAAGTITGSGNASVVVTATGMTGSPKTISVAVTSGDTDATWAGKVRTALAADADVSALFAVSGTTTAIVLTRKPIDTVSGNPIYAGNDGSLNISLDNGTCTGITTASTSDSTLSGVETQGILLYDDGVDFEGKELVGMSFLYAALTSMSTNGSACGFFVSNALGTQITHQAKATQGEVTALFLEPDGLDCTGKYILANSVSAAEITITVIGKS